MATGKKMTLVAAGDSVMYDNKPYHKIKDAAAQFDKKSQDTRSKLVSESAEYRLTLSNIIDQVK
jgi:hypothetical protein